jgi:hypothetical protein
MLSARSAIRRSLELGAIIRAIESAAHVLEILAGIAVSHGSDRTFLSTCVLGAAHDPELRSIFLRLSGAVVGRQYARLGVIRSCV